MKLSAPYWINSLTSALANEILPVHMPEIQTTNLEAHYLKL